MIKVSLENRTDTYTDVDTVSFPSVPTEDVNVDKVKEINSIETIENPVAVVETKPQQIEEKIESNNDEQIVQTKFLGEEHGIRSLLPATVPLQEETIVVKDDEIVVEQKPIYPALVFEFQKTISQTQLLEEPNELDAFKSVPIEESFNDKMVSISL